MFFLTIFSKQLPLSISINPEARFFAITNYFDCLRCTALHPQYNNTAIIEYKDMYIYNRYICHRYGKYAYIYIFLIILIGHFL